MTKHNINELLERKKELETKIEDRTQHINPEELKYAKEVRTDHTMTDKKDAVRELEPRKKKSLAEYTRDTFSMIDELAKVKTAIQAFNAEVLHDRLFKRDATRKKISLLNSIKPHLITETQYGRKVLREDPESHAPLETAEITVEPMFEMVDVEKELDTHARDERKTNTEIQKLNLNAEIEY